jgi:ketosteroid isomerase-like protein
VDETILSLEKAAMERWRNGDPMGFVVQSSKDICYVDPGLTQPIIGLEDYTEFMRKIEGKVNYQKSEFIDPSVVLMGDAALLSYNYRSSVLTPEGELSSQTPWNCTEVYFRQKGEWKIVHNHWSFIKHRAPVSVDVPLTVRTTNVEYSGVLGELMWLEAAAMERWRKGDPWGFIELSAPQVTYFDTGTPQRINGREALSVEYKLREGKVYYEVMDFIEPWVLSCGEMAVMFYRFLSTRLNPDGSIASRFPWNCSEVFGRIDGSWKIIHTHWSQIRGERY